MTSKVILDFIEDKLNTIAQDNGIDDIVFKGNLEYVNYDWKTKYLGVEYTPFALVTNEFTPSMENNVFEFRYQIYMMPFSYDREKITIIMDILNSVIDRPYKIDNANINLTPNNLAMDKDFSEGSGSGIERFELLYSFTGSATYFYNMKNDLTLSINEQNMPVESFKYDNGRVSYINKENAYKGENNHNLNTNILVIQSPLSHNNNVVSEFLTDNQKVNINKLVKLNVGNHIIINDEFEYEGFSLSSSIKDNSMSVFLYFSYKKDITEITINGNNIPILDYAISTIFGTVSKDDFTSNVIKEIYISKARSYAFNISEELGYEVFNLLKEDLIDDTERVPIYSVMINLYGVEINKELLLTDITKESKETGKSVLRVVMTESGEYDG